MKKILGYILLAAGSWMLLSPQSLTGIKYLKWMYNYTFPGEVLLGIVVLSLAYYCLDFKPKKLAKPSH